MISSRIIYIIGPRSCGKTSVMKWIQKKDVCHCIDLDIFLEESLHCSIADYVSKHGWDAFREAESDALQMISTDFKNHVSLIATGGGIVLLEKNREYMRRHGKIVYLKVSRNVLIERLKNDPKFSQRPSLTALSLEEEVDHILKERSSLYEGIADETLDGEMPLEEIGRYILCSIVKTS